MAGRVHETLTNIGRRADAQLDRLAEHLPATPQPRADFGAYLPQAIAAARDNPRFARELADALHQLRTFGGPQ
jgi:hypothetical protein